MLGLFQAQKIFSFTILESRFRVWRFLLEILRLEVVWVEGRMKVRGPWRAGIHGDN